MGKKVSLKQIADKLNISQGAVSLTLNGRGDEMRISKETQKLIMETALAMGYPLERVRKNKQTVGITDNPVIVAFIPALKGDVISPYDRIMNGLNEAMTEYEIKAEILVCPFEYGKLNEKYRYLSGGFCTGAIIFSLSEKDMDDLQEHDFDIPLVVFNRMNEKYTTVYVDDYNVGYNVAKIFKEIGSKRPAIFTPDYGNKPMLLRKMGFEAGCLQFGIELERDYNIVCKVKEQAVDKYIDKLHKTTGMPDTVFANIDDMGLCVANALQRRNINIPDDVEIISYGGNPWTGIVTPALTSIHLNIESMSCQCLKLLWDMIKTGDWKPVGKVFSSKIIYRDSTKKRMS